LISPESLSHTYRSKSDLTGIILLSEFNVSEFNESKLRPDNSSDGCGSFRKMNITWKSGLRLKLRSGCNSSTNFSNGTS
jgi:hypothetical protein